MIRSDNPFSRQTGIFTAVLPVLFMLLPSPDAFAVPVRVSGEIGLVYQHAFRNVEAGRSESSGYESHVRLGVESYAWDPRFLRYSAWGRAFWRDIETTGPAAGGALTTFFLPEQEFLDADYGVTLSFFERRPFRFTLFAMEQTSQYSEQSFSSPYQVGLRTYGGSTSLSPRNFSVFMTGSYSEIDYDNFSRLDSQYITESRVSVRNRTDTHNFRADHHFRNYNTLGLGLDYTENFIFISTDVQPSRRTRYFIRSSARNRVTTLSSGGSAQFNTYTLSPSFNWNPDEWTQYTLNGNFTSTESSNVQMQSGSLNAHANWRIKRNTWLRGGVSGAYRVTDLAAAQDVQSASEKITAGAQYVRFISYYRTTVAYDATAGFSQEDPGEDGFTHSHQVLLATTDNHLKRVVWVFEGTTIFAFDESDQGFDQTIHKAKITARNKKRGALTFWAETVFIDDTRFLPDDTFRLQTLSNSFNTSYKLSRTSTVRWSSFYTLTFEPEEKDEMSTELSCKTRIQRRLYGSAIARYNTVDPWLSTQTSSFLGTASLDYSVRKLRFGLQYSYALRETPLGDPAEEHGVLVKATRRFNGFYSIGNGQNGRSR